MIRAVDDKPVTPYLRLDIDRMQRNIDGLQARLDRLGVKLRPHVKTCKSIEVARRMLGDTNTGITVSTLAEASFFLDHGIRDQIYAVGIAPSKLEAVADLDRRGAKLRIVLDHPATARQVADAAAAAGHRYDVLLEIDADRKRAGFSPDDAALVEAARILRDAGCYVAGVLTHMGGAYACSDRACLERAAETERRAAVEAAEALRSEGFACRIVSVGSTPTARFATDLEGVTEVRAGTHVFMDLVMAGLGVCKTDDVAISVVAEVIGYRQHAGEWLIDAGWMALSADRGTADQTVDHGYGLVAGSDSSDCDLIVRSASQEHGLIARRDGGKLGPDAFRIGQRVAVLPNHACATAAQHDRYRVDGDGAGSPSWWPRMRGW